MKTNRIFSAILAFAMVISMIAWEGGPLTTLASAVWDGTASTSFYSGSGTQSSPYVIKTVGQMGYFRQLLSEGMDFSGKYLRLDANLDMTGGNWTSVSTQFCGDFNGNGYQLTVDTQFVGSIGEAGRVRRLKVVCLDQSERPLICSTNNGTIEGCIATGVVKDSEYYAGGLVKDNHGTMLNVAFIGTVGGKNMDVGGLAYQNTGTIHNAYCSAVLDAYSSGKYGSSSEDPLLKVNNGVATNLYYNTANGASAHGVGMDEASMKAQSFVNTLNQTNTSLVTKWAMDSSAANSGFPVIVADSKSDIECSLSNTDGDAFICNSGTKLTITKSSTKTCTIYYTIDGTDPTTSSTRKTYSSTGITVTGDTTIKMVAKEGTAYGRVRTQTAYVMAGSGTETAPYQITTKAQLRGLHIAPSAYFVLKNDLTFTASDFAVGGIYAGGWKPVQSFSGVLEGNGYAISNMQGSYGGFVETNSGTISGIRFLNHQLSVSGTDFGPIAHTNSGTITKCYVDLNVDTTAYYAVGGIAGNNTGVISYCQLTGSMTARIKATYTTARVSGIAGYCYNGGRVDSCYSKLKLVITGPANFIYYGGISHYGYVYNCRNDGTVEFNTSVSYDVYAYAISGEYGSNNYGALTYTEPGYNNHLHAYDNATYAPKTGSEAQMESNFPQLDFTEKWMILADGPMPQGIMNADGKCYTKTGYRQPACANGYTNYVDQFGNTGAISLAANGTHFGGTATCTNRASCEVCGVSYGSTNPTNHTMPAAATVQNDSTYPFTYANGQYTSTNKVHSSTSALTITAPAAMTVVVVVNCSSESNYDKGIITKNGATVKETSGTVGIRVSVTLAAGDVLAVKYSKDGSVSNGNDCITVSFELPQVNAEPTCTSSVNCVDCGAVLKAALGHNYMTGANDTTYPFTFADGKYTSTNKTSSSVSTYTYTASTAVKLTVAYSVSSESGYDKLTILKNGSTLYTCSGEHSATKEITLAAGDRLAFQYSKDGSGDRGSDSASFAIKSQVAADPCTQSMRCAVCNVVTPAAGHSFTDCICTVCGAEDLRDSGSCGENVSWRLRRDGKMIISGTGAMQDYKSAEAPWYQYIYSYNVITSVIIEDGVTSVGSYAFSYCKYLTEVVIGDSVTVIGTGAFRSTGLRKVTLGKNVVELGEDSFYESFYLSNVILPEGLKTIGRSAFSWCLEMTEMAIPDSVTSLGIYAFCNNDKLETVTMGSGVTAIADDAFCHCDKLTGIWVSEANEYFCSDASGVLYSKDKTKLIQIPNTYTGSYVIPDSVAQIGSYAFYGCNGITEVTVSAGVTAEKLNIYLDSECENLTGIWVSEDNGIYSSDASGVLFNKDKTALLRAPAKLSGSYEIPEGVETVGSGAFWECDGLGSVYLPESVTSVGRNAFLYCSSSLRFSYGGTSDQWALVTNSDETLAAATVHFMLDHEAKAPTCTEVGWDAYRSCTDCAYTTYVEIPALGHSFTEYVSDNNATCVTDCTKTAKCDRCDATDTAAIPDTSLGHAFLDGSCIRCGDTVALYTYEVNDGMATVTACLPEAAVGVLMIPGELDGYPVAAIGDNAFSGCDQLTNILLPDTVTAIGSNAFSGCAGLTVVTMPAGITSVGASAFSGCAALTTVYYSADQTQLESVSISEGNEPLLAATWNFQHIHDYTLLPAVTVDPTCTQDGYIEHMCIFGETYRQTIPALGHDYSGILTVDPTCTQDGYTQIYCSRCGDVKTTEPIAALGHDYSGQVTVVEADCVNAGYTVTQCIRCDSTETTDPVEALGHSCTETVQTVEPDCLSGGYTVYKCIRCQVTETRDHRDALGHSCTEPVQTVEPDCLSGGYTVYQCIRCQVTETRDHRDALGHDYSGTVTVIPSTCTDRGYTLTQCIRCDSQETSNITNVVAHRMVILPSVPATCTTPGLTIGSACQWCGFVGLAQKEIAATGHTIVYHEAQAPTCIQPGWEAYECCENCDYSTQVELTGSHSIENEVCTLCGYQQVDLKITTVTLRPEVAGLYFTGSFAVEEGISVACRGIVVSVYDPQPIADGNAPRSFWTEGTTSVLVANILSTKADADNEARGAMAIYARAYVELADGTYRYSDVVSVNLRQVVEAADALWESMRQPQREAFAAMYLRYEEFLKGWNLPNVKK